MSPLLSHAYSSIHADADDDDDDVTTVSSSPSAEVLTVSTVAAAAVDIRHHMVKVSGYSRLKCTHGTTTGICLESGEFEAGGHAWRLHCYLNGARDVDAGFVSIFLTRIEDATTTAAAVVVAEAEFELLHAAGEPAKWPSSHVVRPAARLFRVGSTWGWPRFIGVEELERSGWFLKDDCFAVRCTVTVVEVELVEEDGVGQEDLERMGMVCACEDGSCNLRHERPPQTPWEIICLFSRLICGEASS